MSRGDSQTLQLRQTEISDKSTLVKSCINVIFLVAERYLLFGVLCLPQLELQHFSVFVLSAVLSPTEVCCILKNKSV